MEATRLYFAAGDFGDDPDAVTRLLRIQPSRVWRRGEPRPGRKGPPVRHELWALDSSLPSSEPFEAHLAELLAVLEQNPNGVREAAARFGAVFQCYSQFETANPGFAIPAELVRRTADLGLGFDFDLYVLYEDEPEESDPPSAAV